MLRVYQTAAQLRTDHACQTISTSICLQTLTTAVSSGRYTATKPSSNSDQSQNGHLLRHRTWLQQPSRTLQLNLTTLCRLKRCIAPMRTCVPALTTQTHTSARSRCHRPVDRMQMTTSMNRMTYNAPSTETVLGSTTVPRSNRIGACRWYAVGSFSQRSQREVDLCTMHRAGSGQTRLLGYCGCRPRQFKLWQGGRHYKLYCQLNSQGVKVCGAR